METKFANAKAVLRPHWWPEDAAGHGTGFIELAGPGLRIEDGTGLVVGKVRELRFRVWVFIKQSGCWVAGER
jgi:hypothetical protein